MEKVVNLIAAIACTVLLLCMSTVAKAESPVLTKYKAKFSGEVKHDKKRKRRKRSRRPFIIVVESPSYNVYRPYRYNTFTYRGYGSDCRRHRY